MATAAKFWYIKAECTNPDGSLDEEKVKALEPINGVSAMEVLKDNFFKNARKLFLIYDDETGIVSQIQSLDVIKSNNSKYSGKTDEEVMQLFLEEQLNPPTPEPTLEDTAMIELMEGQLSLYEQNTQILTILETAFAASAK